MPSLWGMSYQKRCELMKQRRAKLIAKGLDPRSQKFNRLLYR